MGQQLLTQCQEIAISQNILYAETVRLTILYRNRMYALVMTLPAYNSDEIIDAIRRADYNFVLENAMPHALAGNTDAQCTIALLYQCGWGVGLDYLEAERWLLKATAQNSPLAWHNLGTLYSMRHPVLENRRGDAETCWKKATELGFDCG